MLPKYFRNVIFHFKFLIDIFISINDVFMFYLIKKTHVYPSHQKTQMLESEDPSICAFFIFALS